MLQFQNSNGEEIDPELLVSKVTDLLQTGSEEQLLKYKTSITIAFIQALLTLDHISDEYVKALILVTPQVKELLMFFYQAGFITHEIMRLNNITVYMTDKSREGSKGESSNSESSNVFISPNSEGCGSNNNL